MMETLLVNGLSKYIFIVRNKNAVDEKAFEKLEAIIYIYIYIYGKCPMMEFFAKIVNG